MPSTLASTEQLSLCGPERSLSHAFWICTFYRVRTLVVTAALHPATKRPEILLSNKHHGPASLPCIHGLSDRMEGDEVTMGSETSWAQDYFQTVSQAGLSSQPAGPHCWVPLCWASGCWLAGWKWGQQATPSDRWGVEQPAPPLQISPRAAHSKGQPAEHTATCWSRPMAPGCGESESQELACCWALRALPRMRSPRLD